MKKLLQIPLLLVTQLITSVSVSAHDFEVDGIYYNIISSTDKKVKVTYKGTKIATNISYSGSVKIPSSVTYGSNTYSVTAIDNHAFYDCTGLTSVTIPNSVIGMGYGAFCNTGLKSLTIPNSVTSIGDAAFTNCRSLTNVILEDGDKTIIGVNFYNSPVKSLYLGRNNCSFGVNRATLKSLTIGDKVTSIGIRAFDGCTGLTTVNIPNSVTSIGDAAFQYCTGLTSVTIGNSVTTIGGSAFSGCTGLTTVNIPNSVTTIGGSAFSGCTGLTSVTIPNSVTYISHFSPFSGCSRLTNLIIEDGEDPISPLSFPDSPLETVYLGRSTSDAFAQGKTTLKTLTIGGKVTSITYNAFKGCSGLTGDLTIPNSVTSIGNYAFQDCTGLTSVTIPNSVTSIGNVAFWGCCGLSSLIIEDGEDPISPLSFPDSPLETVYLGRSTSDTFAQGKTTLKTLTIGDKVTSIASNAFQSCSGLTSVTIPNSVTSIGSSAFSGCTGLTGDLTIPNSVTTIGSNAFFYCYSLSSINIPNSVTTIEGNAFGDCSGITTLTIGNSVKIIGDYAFDGCSKLTELTIPKSVETIGKYAFDGMSSLSELVLEDGKTFISGLSFPDSPIRSLYLGRNTLDIFAKGKTSLVELHVGANVKEIPNSSFEYCTGLLLVQMRNRSTCRRIGNNAFKGCRQLESLTLGNSVDVIGESAFLGCTSLTSVNLKLVSKMGSSAFAGCENLNTISIPNTLSSISYGVFYGCKGLKSLTIGKRVKNIGNNAFLGCEALTNITSLNTTPPICESSCFSDVIYSKATLRTPIGTKDLYSEVSTWKEFFNTTDDALVSVSVTTQAQNVKFAVPKISEAIKYSVNVYKDKNLSDLAATQSYDASGQIMPMSTSIELEVVGLEYGLYYYEVIVTNESDNALYNDVGSFDIVRPTDENGYHLICNTEELIQFARIVNGDSNNASLNAKLMADIDLSDYPYFSIGTVDNNYRGIFDGNGKKLTIALYGNEYVAPIAYVKGATIKNLTVDGTINAKSKFASGIVGRCVGDSVKILNCISQVSIISSVSGDGTHAGLVAVVSSGATLDITNCAFVGSISNGPSGSTDSCAGLIGWVEDGATSLINNSYVAAAFNVSSYYSNVFARNTSNVTATNCYYLNSFGGSLSGTIQKNSEQFARGEVAYLLQGEKSEHIWGQNIDNGDEIQLFPTLNGAKVYFGYKNFNGVDSLVYTNDSTATPIEELSRDENGNYLIYTASDLYLFASLSNIGMITKANAKLMNDINISEYPKFTLGTASNAYNGVFDGNGNTLTVALEGKEFVAPMGYVNGATVKNLVVDGTINASGKWAAGIIGRIIGNHVSISNCISKVAINSSINGSGTHGGIVGEAYSGTLSIVNCGSEVSINGESTTNCGGLIGWTNITATISNSYSSVDFNIKVDENCNTFVRNSQFAKLSNCYYLTEVGITPSGATLKSLEQFANGEVAYLLQGDQSEHIWGQNIDNGKERQLMPILNGDKVYFGYKEINGVDTLVYTNDSTALSVFDKMDRDENGFYLISTANELLCFTSLVNGLFDVPQDKGACAKLMADIDLENAYWTPICETGLYYKSYGEDLGYSGTFDGNGHVIRNIKVKSSTTAEASCGLFGTASGTIKNLGIEGFTFEDGGKDFRAGAIVGQLITNSGKVSNCYVINATINPKDHVCGGISGCAYEATIENCYVTNSTIIGTNNRYGHIVGDTRGDNSTSDRKGYVNNCYTDNSIVYSAQSGNISNCKQVVSEQFASGEVAYLLQGEQAKLIWGQNIDNGEEVQLLPTLNGAKVYYGYKDIEGTNTLVYTNDSTVSEYAPVFTQWKYYYNDTNWGNSTVYTYVWDAGNGYKQYLGSWPGTPMQKNEDGMWEISFVTQENLVNPMVIFSNGYSGSSNQTADLILINNGIYNFSGYTNITGIDLPHNPIMKIEVVNSMIIITAERDDIVSITAADGRTRFYEVKMGKNYISDLPKGFYIVNKTKVVL